MNRGIIYCYTFNNGKCYVGQTIDEEGRKRNHKFCALNGSDLLFHRALRKYNFEYTYEILKEIYGNTKEEVINKLNKYEEFYIKQLRSMYNENGYNLHYGGNNKTSEIAKEKVSQTKKTNEKYRKIAIEAGMKNAKVVVALNKYGEVIKEFESISEANRYYNLTNGFVAKHISQLYSWCKQSDCYFRFKDTDYDKRIKPFIARYGLNNKLIDIYTSYKDTGFCISSVYNAVIKNKIYKDSYWKTI